MNKVHSYSKASEVSICNKALRYLGAAEIISLAQNSREAELCQKTYAEARNELLAAHPWSFATRYATLAPIAQGENVKKNMPEFSCHNSEFKKAFLMPVDAIAILGFTDKSPFLLGEGNIIYTNSTTAKAILLTMQIDPANFPPLFIDALARRIAASLAISLINNARLEETMLLRFRESFEIARLADAVQEYTVESEACQQNNSWLQMR